MTLCFFSPCSFNYWGLMGAPFFLNLESMKRGSVCRFERFLGSEHRNMTEKEFDKICAEILGAVLSEKIGFVFLNGTYFREKDTGIRELIIIDFDSRSKKTFRVLVGLNATAISEGLSPDEAGTLCVKYVNGRVLSSSGKNLPCFNRAAALSSLSQILDIVDSVIIPWFNQFKSMHDLASCAEDFYLFHKGKLFLLSGDLKQAEHYLSKHVAYLENKPQSPEILVALSETKILLGKALNTRKTD